MKIPREFQRELLAFIDDELSASVFPLSPVDLAKCCGAFSRRWFGLSESQNLPLDWDVVALVAWAERFGKHVGEFFLNYKEG